MRDSFSTLSFLSAFSGTCSNCRISVLSAPMANIPFISFCPNVFCTKGLDNERLINNIKDKQIVKILLAAILFIPIMSHSKTVESYTESKLC